MVTSAHRINQGLMPDLSSPGPDSDFYFVQVDDPATAVSRISELAKTRIPRSHPRHPGAVSDEPQWCWCAVVEHRTAGGAQSRRRPQGRAFGWTFALGDKVMQMCRTAQRVSFF
jgi:exodeoxyribonuclease V alpha subunit